MKFIANFTMQAIRFFMSSNLTVQGIRVKDSPQFNFRFDNCKNVHIESIHITAPPLSPNTDGIHIENANDVKIYNSVISNGLTPKLLNNLSISQFTALTI